MSKPIKHPKTGIYQFRKRVPLRLRALVGKREEKVSLNTRDLDEALIRHAVAERKCLRRWRSLEAGAVDLSVKQCRAIAGELCRERIAEFEENAEDPAPWRAELLRLERERTALTGPSSPAPELVAGLLCRPAVDAFLERNGIVASATARLRLLRVATDAFEKAAAHLENAACGIYADPAALPFPPLSVFRTAKTGAPLLTVWQSYVLERGVADATKKRWLPVLTKFVAFAGTDDFERISRQKILDWKAHLLETDLEPRTIADVHLAAVKTLFGHAYRNNIIAENPAERIAVAYRVKPRTREQGYTRDEAYFVLDSCRGQDPAVHARDRAATLRWVPWICAYTGARIGEITQMRPCDIYRSGRDTAMMKITPEAGRQKAGSYRDVAIHSHLLAQGFLEYVLACGTAPLFYDPARAQGEPNPAKLSAKSGEWLAAWIRSNCIKDRRIAPNHAWRHRFKSNSRTIGMREDFAELIMGHAPNGASRLYGNYWPVLSRRQMELQSPYVMPDMSLLAPEEISAQLARLPRRPTDSLQPKEDAEKLELWLRRFKIPDLELPAVAADGVGSADFGA